MAGSCVPQCRGDRVKLGWRARDLVVQVLGDRRVQSVAMRQGWPGSVRCGRDLLDCRLAGLQPPAQRVRVAGAIAEGDAAHGSGARRAAESDAISSGCSAGPVACSMPASWASTEGRPNLRSSSCCHCSTSPTGTRISVLAARPRRRSSQAATRPTCPLGDRFARGTKNL